MCIIIESYSNYHGDRAPNVNFVYDGGIGIWICLLSMFIV